VPAIAGEWLVDPGCEAAVRGQLRQVVERHRAAHPLDDGPSVEAATRSVGLTDRRLLEALVQPPLVVRAGRVVPAESSLPAYVLDALDLLAEDLADAPFAAPDAARLTELGLRPPELAAAERAGRLLRVADGVVLLPDAPHRAAERLGTLPQPFSVAEARTALGSSRRVTVPLLELLDGLGRTRRGPHGRWTVRPPASGNTGD
jgi:selenocysteine-specific elongation factor